MKKQLMLMTCLLFMSGVSQASFYNAKRDKSVKVEKKKRINKKSVKAKVMKLVPVSIAMVGRPASKKGVSFSSKNKFVRQEVIVVDHNKRYVYGKVTDVENSAKGKTTGFYFVKPSLVRPFLSLKMKSHRMGKIK